ncbi:hypothetical protein [Aerolutibacter daejeonensis]|nr:hypothetical protein [Lysobacter daejeonensis]
MQRTDSAVSDRPEGGHAVVEADRSSNSLEDPSKMDAKSGSSTQGGVVANGSKRVRLTVLLSALLVPVAYVFGRSYIEAWIKAHGLPVEAFAISIEEALLGAYIGMLQGATRLIRMVVPDSDLLLPGYIALIALCFLLAYIWMWLSGAIIRTTTTLLRRMLRFAGDKLHADRFTLLRQRVVPAFFAGYFVASLPLVIVAGFGYLVLLSILPALAGSKIGELEGLDAKNRAMSAVARGEFNPEHQFAELDDHGGGATALVVKCGDRGCGVMGKAGPAFVTWEGIKRISAGGPFPPAPAAARR